MSINPGEIVFGNTEEDPFLVLQPIGNGSFGIVYEVQHLPTGNHFALKTIIATMLDADGLRALTNEGLLASSIEHENVLRVYYFHDGHRYPQFPPYMIMELAEGGTLQSSIDERRVAQAVLPNEELRRLFISLALGMKAINEKLVHRDVKPDNILVVKGVLKISDFGLSKAVGALTRTQTFKGINHIRYCAPEAWQLEKNTPAMDMYSMGIVFYELATLNYPYNVKTTGNIVDAWKNAHQTQTPQIPNTINPALDANLAQLIMKMIAKRPEDRYSNWDDVIQRIETPSAEPKSQSKVASLVQKAISNYHTAEEGRLKQEAEAQRQREYEEIIAYCFQEIVKVAQSIVDEFNGASEFAKLEFRHLPPFSFDIRRERSNTGRVVATITPLHEVHRLGKQRIKAWGFAKAPSGHGFNLLLIETDPDDVYGKWITFHAGHHSLMQQHDRRPSPFPFELEEIPKEIQLIEVMHAYTIRQDTLKSEFFTALIEELL